MTIMKNSTDQSNNSVTSPSENCYPLKGGLYDLKIGVMPNALISSMRNPFTYMAIQNGWFVESSITGSYDSWWKEQYSDSRSINSFLNENRIFDNLDRAYKEFSLPKRGREQILVLNCATEDEIKNAIAGGNFSDFIICSLERYSLNKLEGPLVRWGKASGNPVNTEEILADRKAVEAFLATLGQRNTLKK